MRRGAQRAPRRDQELGGETMLKRGSRWLALLAPLAMLVASTTAFADAYDPGHWNMPIGVTEVSRTVYDLHMLIFWICVAIAVLVFGAMFYSVFAHRRSRHPKPADFHESTSIEIIWTIIPFAILIGMAIPAAGTLIKMEDVRGAELSVKVTGYQWKWQYDYVDHGVSFFSTLHADHNHARQLDSGVSPESLPHYLLEVDNRLVLPVGKKVRFLVTANDVIHAWWVPDLAVKKDAIPGFVNETWAKADKPGVYRGVCAELCGRDHGFMPIVVEIVEAAAFDQWLAAMKAGQPTAIGHGPGVTMVASATLSTAGMAPVPAGEQVAAAAPSAPPATPAAGGAAAPAAKMSTDELMKNGEKVYTAQCVACHQPTGKGMPPTFPALVGSKVANGPADAHIQHTLKGKNAMPAFAHLSDVDLASAITYERSSWGNKGGPVQPAQVAAQRGK
jgi:cytochrome c oxidase subunit II